MYTVFCISASLNVCVCVDVKLTTLAHTHPWSQLHNHGQKRDQAVPGARKEMI